MAKIVSRVDNDAARVELLQRALINFSFGAVTKDNQGAMQVGDDIDTLVSQAVSVMASLVQTLEHTAVDLSIMRVEAAALQMQVDQLESTVESLLQDVSYDEALDHATTDLMDCFASSGAVDVTADGELAFDERVTFSKEDLKPMVREAIIRWIALKLEQ